MRTSLLVVAGVLALSAAAGAWHIPGTVNELANPAFEYQGDPWYGWQHGTGLGVGPATGHGHAVYCKDPQGDLLLRQVVDETDFPDNWDPNGNAKIIDVALDVLCQDLTEDSTSGLEFQFDFWRDMGDDPPQGTPQYRGLKTILFKDLPNYAPNTWLRINPYDQDATIFPDFQPRWISFEVRLIQGAGETVWVDNFDLSAKCIPEPSMIVAMLTGLGGLGAGLLRRKLG